jgi:hypothetical protein
MKMFVFVECFDCSIVLFNDGRNEILVPRRTRWSYIPSAAWFVPRYLCCVVCAGLSFLSQDAWFVLGVAVAETALASPRSISAPSF